MLPWIWLVGGLALAAAAVGLIVAMAQAERRARRSLFRTLGLDEATVGLLMARNGDVMAELALVRRRDLSSDPGEPEPAPHEPPGVRARPAIRLVHPTADEAAHGPSSTDPRRPPGDRRRLGLPGRS